MNSSVFDLCVKMLFGFSIKQRYTLSIALTNNIVICSAQSLLEACASGDILFWFSDFYLVVFLIALQLKHVD